MVSFSLSHTKTEELVKPTKTLYIKKSQETHDLSPAFSHWKDKNKNTKIWTLSPPKKPGTWHFFSLPSPFKNKLSLTLYFTLPNSPTLLVPHSRNVHFFFSTLIASHHQATSTSSFSSTTTQHLFAALTSFSIFTTTTNPTLV